MFRYCLFLTFFLASFWVAAQDLYVQTFGDAHQPALIFLHGGPGYNSASFEATTAQRLSEEGFYVVVYDRRGEGRSERLPAEFTVEQSLADLHQLYRQLHLKKAVLLGHSFGGMLATLYAERYPKRVKGMVLIGAPMELSATFANIRARCTAIYKEKEDATNLYYMGLLEKMDPASIDYASYCFAHALQNGFYSPASPSPEASALYHKFASDPLLQQYGSKMTREAPLGFWKKEQYTTFNVLPHLETVLQQKTPVLALYGQEDGLFSEAQIQQLETFVGTAQLYYWKNCSHNVYIDQQSLFITTLKNWLADAK